MTTEKKRAVASLRTVIGYNILLEEVIKPRRDAALERLILAKGRDEILESALAFRAWTETVAALEAAPRNMEEELKMEGDEIYG